MILITFTCITGKTAEREMEDEGSGNLSLRTSEDVLYYIVCIHCSASSLFTFVSVTKLMRMRGD